MFFSQDMTHDWNVGLGQLLLAAKSKDEKSFNAHLRSLRHELMGPLSAASMEVGSYHRGYKYIVRLHMLSELENMMQAMCDFIAPPLLSASSSFVGAGHNCSSFIGRPDDPSLSMESLMSQWEVRPLAN